MHQLEGLHIQRLAAVKKGVMELDTINAILSQNTSLSHQMVNITKQLNEMKVNVVSSTQPASL